MCGWQWARQGVGGGAKKERDNSTLQILDSLQEEPNLTWRAQDQNWEQTGKIWTEVFLVFILTYVCQSELVKKE